RRAIMTRRGMQQPYNASPAAQMNGRSNGRQAPPPLTPRGPARICAPSCWNPKAARDFAQRQGHEGQKLAKVAQDASPRLQARAPQGPRLRHQQDRPALQGQAGLTLRPMSPKAVLWDIGNVIVRWNPRTLYEKIFQEPAECDRFLTHVCSMEWHGAHDLGVSFAENGAALIARHPEYEAEIRAWRERWWEMFSGAIPETEAAIEALHARGVRSFGLSNISGEVIDGVRADRKSTRL